MASSTLIGILLDVSGSMRVNVNIDTDQQINDNARSWVYSTFDVIRSLVMHNIRNSEVFAIGVGSFNDHTFDLLNTLKRYQSDIDRMSYEDVLEEAMKFVENNGARFIRRWAKKNMVKNCISRQLIISILKKMKSDKTFRNEFIFNCLPRACREWDQMKVQGGAAFGVGGAIGVGLFIANPLLGVAVLAGTAAAGGGAAIAASQREGTEEEIKAVVEKAKKAMKRPTRNLIEEILAICQSNGALYIRRWCTPEIWANSVTSEVASVIREQLIADQKFRNEFVHHCLPQECRVSSGIHSNATEADVMEVFDKAKDRLVVKVSDATIIEAKQATNIIDGFLDPKEKKDFTNNDIKTLIDVIDPFIYGQTPLIEALNQTLVLFRGRRRPEQKKVLFVLSDGDPTDGHVAPIAELGAENITVVCCYVSQQHLQDPKRMYNRVDSRWNKGAKFLFNLSSVIPTQELPLTIFTKEGWTVDISNNETRLFVQANHPDIVNDVCNLVKDIVCCQDALGDMLSSISLDVYINLELRSAQAPRQVGGTCYANAAATVLHLSMKRIKGRHGGYPLFSDLRRRLIEMYGYHGASTMQVLQQVCPGYRLHCQPVDSDGAMKAVVAKRPVIGIFYLTDQEWDAFSSFYDANPRGVLSMNELDIQNRPVNVQVSGHAVVLVGFNSKGLRFMNSWGNDWADEGFFRVSNADVLDVRFIDVYWTLNDLLEDEKRFFAVHGAQDAAQWLRSLSGLQSSMYECPICHDKSPINKYKGSMSNAKCPKCQSVFISDKYLKLYLYLLSLSE